MKSNERALYTMGCNMLALLYVPYLFNSFTRIAFSWDEGGLTDPVGRQGVMLALYTIGVVKLSDVGAYFTGRAIGRHKLFPRISPKKTWEGLIGGMLAAIAASMAFAHFSTHLSGLIGPVHAAVLGLLLAVAGVLGDMFESVVKRAAGFKDSSSVIPGMGGLLDVLDSLLFGAPLLLVYARLFL
jgi:phosphatidate cytidylyltransferase